MDWIGPLLLIICLVGFPVAVIKSIVAIRKNARLRDELSGKDAAVADLRKQVERFAQEHNRLQSLERIVAEELPKKDAAIESLAKNKQGLEEQVRALSRYQSIIDIDAEISKKQQAFVDQRNASIAKLQEQIDEAKVRIKAQFEQARQAMAQAELEKTRIIQSAEEEARQIAGKALEAAQREGELQAAIKAMENTITGYDDSYLIPAETLLDELAEQYDFKEAGQELKKVRDKVRLMVKTQIAATCDYVEAKRRETAIRFVLDAFNGKVDTVMAKVRHDNYGILKQQIIDAYSIVNNNGAAFRKARIIPEYLNTVLEELKWAVATTELVRQDKEEQRRIKQEMQEEAKAQREYEKAVKAAEKEEQLLQQAMEKARLQMATATEAQRAEYESQLRDLEEKLRIAEEKNQRAIAMAQQTRQGHVYVISNIGSFGDNVLKIGMTRRLEPMDRIRELGDASVPFPFDVHAMIFSDDAPSLETQLHNTFADCQINKVNPRKEFFSLDLGQIKSFVQKLGVETHWTMRAEAMEYRESKTIAKRQGGADQQMLDSMMARNRNVESAVYMSVQ